MNEIESYIHVMDNYSFVVEDNPSSRVPKLTTVLTSLPYSSRYNMEITNGVDVVECSIVNICGKLACVYQGDGVSDYAVKIKTSYTALATAVILWFMFIVTIIYNMFKLNVFSTKEEVDVKQEDN
ncbi:MAG: hypothetical protein MJ094_09400, partial [Saccharofermentans sp.]|nr:hypothetical protein [Saccharofermentans sp.]